MLPKFLEQFLGHSELGFHMDNVICVSYVSVHKGLHVRQRAQVYMKCKKVLENGNALYSRPKKCVTLQPDS